MHDLRAANDLLGDPGRLHDRLTQDGYLFLRNVIDAADVTRVRGDLLSWCHAQGLVSSPASTIWSGYAPPGLVSQPEDLHAMGMAPWLFARPSLQNLIRQLLDEEPFLLPINEYHFTWPGKAVPVGIHQDGVGSNNMGFSVFWIPLVEITPELGGIEIAVGQHTRGHLHPIPGLPHPYIPSGSLPADSWARATYRPGDVLVIDQMTPHRGLPNSSDRLRLSIDIRVLPASTPPPAIGIVVRITATSLTLRTQDGTEVCLLHDEATIVRGENARQTAPAEITDYLGKPAIVAHEDGRATLVRRPQGGAAALTSGTRAAGHPS
ncbi:phytanoyl-CoA dioxygenase family protein [Nocardioides sp.]|uniref:phytanoyl-CoA dioxygenase family protein n=1 Tax=Nocardioides sp. TaxID=35761 RepID=UPI003D0D476B